MELANEVHLPLGETTDFRLDSADVIHSFWIPSLGGKIDMFPGRTTRLSLQATRTGIFRGVCAEYCGTAHALMSFYAVVQERADFDRWLAHQAQPARIPTEPLAVRGQELFLGNGCGACHAVRGTAAKGVVGPDLTHVGSRQSIGGGILPNDPANFQRAFCFFLFGGVLALLMRVQLAVANNQFLSADRYNQIFTMHGTVMMFLFAIPIFEAFSIFILPSMIGTRDLPFPRLSAYGFWSFALGGAFFCGSLFFNAAPHGGWFMYPPLTTRYQPDIGADFWLLGLSFIEIAAIAAAVALIVGVLKCRPPGMRLNLMPLYAWYMLVAAAMVLFAFPPVIAGSLLLEVERAFQWPFFDPSKGGDPLLWQHLFWLFGHPEVYVIFLPSVAIVAMIVPTFARKAIVGYSWIVLAAVGTGFLSFGLWVHHMFTTGLPGISLGLFSAASEAVAIPTGIQLFCFIATLAVGRLVYLIASLAAFARGTRHSGIMEPIATELRPEQIHELARYYGALAVPRRAAAARRSEMVASIERGAAIAQRGTPSQRVPSCVACHDPLTPAHNPLYPKLDGQYADYLVLQLELFAHDGRGGTSYSRLMHPVARAMTRDQMRDVAQYYESVAYTAAAKPRRSSG